MPARLREAARSGRVAALACAASYGAHGMARASCSLIAPEIGRKRALADPSFAVDLIRDAAKPGCGGDPDLKRRKNSGRSGAAAQGVTPTWIAPRTGLA